MRHRLIKLQELRAIWGFLTIGVPFFGGSFKGILLYLGYKRGTPILGHLHLSAILMAPQIEVGRLFGAG